MIELNRGYNVDSIELLKLIPDSSLHIICIDPPYLYLKGQKLERPFDEHLFFSECKRVLKKDGFIVMFGRGTSFYRWNYILDGLGMVFKEEIVWDKGQCSSPLLSISRTHETISIFTKRDGCINRVKVPYMEMKQMDLDAIIGDVKRLKSALKNTEALSAIQEYLENGSIIKTSDKPHKHNTSAQVSGLKTPDRSVAVMQAITSGMNEKSIIRNIRDHYKFIHPTQKPVRLLERLLALVLPKNVPLNEVIVADFFAGSFSVAEAAISMGINWICCEIDDEYYNKGVQRINKIPKTLF